MTPFSTAAFDTMPQIGASLALALPILGTRSLLLRRLAAAGKANALRRETRIRLASTLILVVGLGLVWIAELQSLLLSLTAVTMALVLATKELILCATGTLARRAGGSFRIGDQVQIDGCSGQVIASNLFTTTIAETEACGLGSRPTGRRMVLPNSRMFGAGVHVEDRTAPLRHHAFAITLEEHGPLRELLGFAEAEATLHMPEGASLPRIALSTSDLGKTRIEVAMFCAPGRAFEAEREITLAILDHARGRSAAVPARTGAALTLVRPAA
ncbi:mechanosensitive ion channel domain-containing protein [Aureimonas sp. ME7]|uniref:mechanosensitive ion channel domain-containing protein n=1 Tax=Aureimonas sp. ME7 TaxID=2744252 RepID=UPI0015F3943B|nr:mechanosensitive ion channel domain-containing protein [Aureimonas sp. ME7]